MPLDSRLKPAGDEPARTSSSPLEALYAAETQRIREQFEADGDGRTALLRRSSLIDEVVQQLYQQFHSRELTAPEAFCVVALGGYGRRELFPCSDIDLVFLAGEARTAASQREAVAATSRALWDLRLRVGSSIRVLAECGQLHRGNLEFNISLLDSRYVAGDERLFERLYHQVIPHLVARDGQDLVRDLIEMTHRRHVRYGGTIFHLEPNLKEIPGGLRDYQMARWLTLIAQLEKQEKWVAPEKQWPRAVRAESEKAFDFLCATRCFLHFSRGRDDNQLTYELQDQAAARGIGDRPGERVNAAEWMRNYFRHARSIHRLASRFVDDAGPARSSLYAVVQDWKSRHSNSDFSVVRGRIFLRQPDAVATDPALLLRAFEMVARHALELSREAERWVEESLPGVSARLERLPGLWSQFRRILLPPHAARALRAMHRLGLLAAIFPEFRAIDSLVIRDFYHRYTVDEHSLMTIQALKSLRASPRGARLERAAESVETWEAKFAELLAQLEQPELLLLALLFHDVGKGLPGADHVAGSLEALRTVVARLELDPAERDTVSFLVSQHLAMSATLQRRDIFDLETVRSFAEQVGTLERLKMLCLLTYADIKSVNPDALTPWKAEMLWQLYVATSNYLARSLDDERVRVSREGLVQAERILPLLSPPATGQELSAFLEGFPKRYLAAHSPEEIAGHFQLARRLAENPVQVRLRSRSRLFELTVVTPDRPFLFASITGTLAAWGMNIVKADAFANSSGIILDTFRFADLFRTLELNPPEVDRFTKSLVGVLRGEVDLENLMRARVDTRPFPRPKVKIETEMRFDDASSSHSTLLELITQDRPGLLYQVSSALAGLGINIDVALIDTEGQKVIDVFYLTCQGRKPDADTQEKIRRALLARL